MRRSSRPSTRGGGRPRARPSRRRRRGALRRPTAPSRRPRGGGSRETAIIAYQRAAALDPGDAAACGAASATAAQGVRGSGAGGHVEDGRGRFPRRDRRLPDGAARGDDPSRRAARGDLPRRARRGTREAEPLLARAERSRTTPRSRALYLGLLALREGRGARAAALFARGERTALGIAGRLGPRAARAVGGPWSLTLFAASGFDSNVNLAPPGASAGGATPTGSTLSAPPGSSARGLARPVPAGRRGAPPPAVRLDAYDAASRRRRRRVASCQGRRWSGRRRVRVRVPDLRRRSVPSSRTGCSRPRGPPSAR